MAIAVGIMVDVVPGGYVPLYESGYDAEAEVMVRMMLGDHPLPNGWEVLRVGGTGALGNPTEKAAQDQTRIKQILLAMLRHYRAIFSGLRVYYVAITLVNARKYTPGKMRDVLAVLQWYVTQILDKAILNEGEDKEI